MTHPKTVRLMLSDLPNGRVHIVTTFKPLRGEPITPAQSLALDFTNSATHAGHTANASIDADALAHLAERLLDPDDLGHAVTAEVRGCARLALGRSLAERASVQSQSRAQRVYVSGPMTDVPQLNHPAFNLAAQALRSAGWAVFNPAENGMPPEAPWSEHMRVDIAQLMRCTHVATLEGWQSSRGAVLEVHIANRLGLQVSTLQHLITLGATRARAQEATA